MVVTLLQNQKRLKMGALDTVDQHHGQHQRQSVLSMPGPSLSPPQV